MAPVYFQGSRRDVIRLAYRLRDILVGRQQDSHQVREGFLLSLGFAALSDIKDAYVTKADGGTDEMGVSWPDLSPKTKAYSRRFGPREQATLKKAAGLGRGHAFAPGGNRGLLTKAQLERWKQIFARNFNRLSLSLPVKEAKARAAQIAWAVIKREGAQTKLEVYGSRKVQILRDTGVMLNSLSPGVLSGTPPAMAYSKPSGEGGDKQVFDAQGARIIVGTNDPRAGAHNNGVPGRLPKRQIFPDNAAQIPAVWWQRWLGVGLAALKIASEDVYRDGAA